MTDKAEVPTTWAMVVESDEIYSAKTDRWYEVISSQAMPNGMVRLQARGVPKPIMREAAGETTVRRGPTGVVVDMFVEVLRSGPSRREASGG